MMRAAKLSAMVGMCTALCWAAGLWLPVVAAADAPAAADLIGYGKLGLAVQRGPAGAGVATFTCESAAHADRLLSKLQADFTWDKELGLRHITLRNGAPALALDGCGVLALARKADTVLAVSGASPDAVEALLQQHAPAGPDVAYTPQKPHPMSLDFYDLRPLSVYFMPLNVRDLAKGWHRYDRDVLARTADFWAPFQFGCSMFNPYFGKDELADGAPHGFAADYSVGLAKARGMVVMAHLGQYEAPWWMRNQFPRDIVQWDPAVISGWDPLGAMAGTHLSTSASPEAYAYARRFTAQALDRLRADAGDNLGCVRVVGGGHPGDEMGLHELSTEFMDYDEAGQAGFRNWLREARKLDLAALGQRWFGDPARFMGWDDVRIPSHFEFFGGFGRGTFDLLKDWLWRPDSPDAEAEGWGTSAYRPGDAWTPTDLAPSVQQLFLFGSERDKTLRQGQSTVAWLRKEFDASAWLAANRGRPVYLVASVEDRQNEPVEVYFNDAYLGLIKPKTVREGPIAFEATQLVRPGRNVLCLKVQGGMIHGPVFLTTEEPKRYPYLGRCGNARWVDLRDWTNEKLIRGWLREARFARERLPDIPLLFAPGSWHGFMDRFLTLKREVGIGSIHFTGGGSSYMPWWGGLGYVWGTYMSSEEGGTINDPRALSRELAWMLLNGQGHHNYYYDALDCMRIEQQTGWFTQHKRLFELYAKANWQKPPVAVFRAARTDGYFPYSTATEDGDIGRGALQAAHYGNVYVTEAELKAGLADGYPVVFDAGTTVLDDELLASIERYIRAGGTFVAVATTGRHGLLEADTWPIAKLTGFQVLGEREEMKATIAAGHPLFKRLGGLAFTGSGVALQWAGGDGGEVLARWQDGTVAAGLRTLGSGRVIVLGSSFWRTTDRTATGAALEGSVPSVFFNDLFSGLQIAKQADVDSEDVWVRRFTTKNGLQEWVMAYNAGRVPAKGLTLSLPLERRPGRVLDVVTGKPVRFTWENGTVRVPDMDVPVNEIKVYGVERGDFLDACEHWFGEKRRYESRPTPTAQPEKLPTPPATAVAFDTFRFRQATTAETNALAWLSEPTDTAAWKTVGYGFWDELGYAAKGVGLNRYTFRAPEAWRGRRVLLSFASYDYPVFLENATVYVNGQPVGAYRGHAWANFDVLDITAQLKPGANELALLVQATEGRGGYIGQLAAFAMEKLEDVRELKSGWRFFADNQVSTAVELPLAASGRHLETDVALPASWKDREIFLEFEETERCLYVLVINGHPIAYNQALHPYANIMQVNLYPWAKPGESNRIELWPRSPGEIAKQKFTVNTVRLGTLPRRPAQR
jgi:hypothetical protein